MWKDIHDRFDQGNMFRIVDLQEYIFFLSQGNLGVFEYYVELKAPWDELENFRPLLQCKCSTKCSRGALQSMRTFRDQDYTTKFLKGLNEQYSYLKSQIIMMDSLPPIAKAFSIVIQQEHRFHSPIATDMDNSSNTPCNIPNF